MVRIVDKTTAKQCHLEAYYFMAFEECLPWTFFLHHRYENRQETYPPCLCSQKTPMSSMGMNYVKGKKYYDNLVASSQATMSVTCFFFVPVSIAHIDERQLSCRCCFRVPPFALATHSVLLSVSLSIRCLLFSSLRSYFTLTHSPLVLILTLTHGNTNVQAPVSTHPT